MLALQSLAGIFLLAGIAWALSENRSSPPWRLLLAGIILQPVLALLLLKAPFVRELFLLVGDMATALQDATKAGTSFVFGYLGGGDLPFEASNPTGLFVLAFQALPLILVISALAALLYHWRVLPFLVQILARGLQKAFGIGGAAGLATAANVFIGMVEAPLLVRPWISRINRSELFMIMTAGMATVAGTVMFLYAGFMSASLDGAVGHVLVASLISAPAAIMMAGLMIPPARDAAGTGSAAESGDLMKSPFSSSMDALVAGTMQGVQLLINVTALLLVFVALVWLANRLLGLVPLGETSLSLEMLLGYVMAPIAWAMGIPWDQAVDAGALLGVKIILNEFLAYLQLAGTSGEVLDDRSRLIMTYALCGFANFGSLGIMIGGLTAMAPERRAEIAALGLRSLVSGTLATCSTGAVIGLLSALMEIRG